MRKERGEQSHLCDLTVRPSSCEKEQQPNWQAQNLVLHRKVKGQIPTLFSIYFAAVVIVYLG